MSRAYGTPIKLNDLEGTERLVVSRMGLLPLSAIAVHPSPFKNSVLYRVEAVRYAGFNPYATEYGGEWYTATPQLEVHGYWVAKWTKHGATLLYINCPGGRRKWVDLRADAKQWASLDLETAVKQFAKRRERQIYILQEQLARAKAELALTQPQVIRLPSN